MRCKRLHLKSFAQVSPKYNVSKHHWAKVQCSFPSLKYLPRRGKDIFNNTFLQGVRNMQAFRRHQCHPSPLAFLLGPGSVVVRRQDHLVQALHHRKALQQMFLFSQVPWVPQDRSR